MLPRRLTQLILVCLAVTITAFAQNSGTSYLLQLPGAGSGANRIVGYLAGTSDLDADLDTFGPNNADRVLVTPNGQKFYLVSDGPIQVIDAQFQSFASLNNLTGPFKSSLITPDGKYLILLGSSLQIIDTQTNAIVNTNLGVTGTPSDIATSPDGKTAYLLQQFGLTSAITTLNLTTMTAGTRTDLPTLGNTISVSPVGQIYITGANRIGEYNPTDLSQAAVFSVFGTPDRIKFTPDGTRAYYINLTPQAVGRSLQSFRTAQRDLSEWPPFSFTIPAPIFDDVFVVANDRVLVYQKSAKTLYEITPSPLSGVATNLNNSIVADKVYAVVASNEIPSARFLYVITDDQSQVSLKRISLADNTVSVKSTTTLTNGVLRYVAIPAQTGAINFLKFNDNQLLTSGGAAKKLMFRVTDALGRPVFNQPVTFTSSSSDAVLSNSSTLTTSDGYAETGYVVPNTPGTYTVAVTAGGANTTFTITVPGAGGGGGATGPNLMSVYSGNGQVVKEFSPIPEWSPLVTKVVDANGVPVAGVPVTFSVIQGTGVTVELQSETDEDGLASTSFFSQGVPYPDVVAANIVRAESAYGSVDFTVTVIQLDPRNQSGSPTTSVQTPDRTTIGRGDVVKNFFVVQTIATRFPQIGQPIPNVGLRIADNNNFTLPGPGTCVNNTLGDNLGISRCDFKSTCDIGDIGSLKPIAIAVGEFRLAQMYVTIAPGTAQMISSISGNNQVGTAGQLLAAPLVARVSDNCGSGVAGRPVVWTVTQGSATLSQVVTTSAADGRVSARLTLGQTPGAITVRVAMEGAAPVTFQVTNQVIVSGISLSSGGAQTATVGTKFTNPMVFVVRDNGNKPVPGISVAFSVTGGGSVSPLTATTDELGRAQTTVTAGNTPGTTTVTASYLSFTASGSVTSIPAGLNLTSTMFTNAASGATGLVPCGLVTVSATGLAPGVAGVLNGTGFGPLPYSLGPIRSITVNNFVAPIQAVANQNGKEQINFQVPCEATPGTATVVINVNGQTNTVAGVPVLAGQPGIFTYAGPNNKTYGAVIRLKDGSYITPSNPAVTGESYWIILTGMGQTTPGLVTNSPGLPNQTQTVNLQTIVGVNNAGMPAQPAKYLPGATGVYYVEFTIPKGSPTGVDQPLAVAVINNGQVVFGNPVLLPAVVAGP